MKRESAPCHGSSKLLPKYRKHKASGQAIVSLDGQIFYLGPFGTQVSKRNTTGSSVNGKQTAVGCHRTRLPASPSPNSAAAYWRYAKGYYVKNGKPTDEQSCIRTALRHTRQLYGNQPVTEFGPLALKTVRTVMVDRGNWRKYINSNVNRIRRMFKWGVANEMVPVTVHQALMAVDGLKAGKCDARETGPVLPVDDAVIDATIEHCSQTVADMIRFQRLTGCRPGEVRTIRPCDVDRTHEVWRYTPASHKMEHKGRHRVILIGPKAQAVLAPYLLRDPERLCFTRPRKRDMFKRWTYNEAIHRACDKAFPAPEGTEGQALKEWKRNHRWAPNRLRHSAATDVRRQFGLEGSQAVLGHASADVTQIYAERDLVRAAEIMKIVG